MSIRLRGTGWTSAEGSRGSVSWINGIANGPEGSLYYTENGAIRKIDRNGEVSTVVSRVEIPGCGPTPLPDFPPGAYLRALTVDPAGVIHVAATGCGATVRVGPARAIAVVRRVEWPWLPTGVAAGPGGIYVLEYNHSGEREAWIPRVVRIGSGGKVEVLVTVSR